jgi:hypothetical protein
MATHIFCPLQHSKFSRRSQTFRESKLPALGFSSRQVAKSAKFGQNVFLKNLASLRLSAVGRISLNLLG